MSHPAATMTRMPDTDQLPAFRTPIRGYRFAARPPRADHPRPGQVARLVREVGHPADRWAVAVWIRAEDGTPWRIGYLERAVAARLGPRLDEGHELTAAVAGWVADPSGRWHRPVLRIGRSDGLPQAENTACTVNSAPSGSSRSNTAASTRRNAAHARPARRFAEALSARPGSSPTST